MQTVYQQLDNASIHEVVAYLRSCLATEKTGATPQEIAGYMSVLLGSNKPWEWYKLNRYPPLTKIMDEAPSLEIGNVCFSESYHLQELKGLVDELERMLD